MAAQPSGIFLWTTTSTEDGFALKLASQNQEVMSKVVGDGELKKAACLGEIGVAQHPFFPGAHRHVRSYQEVDRFSRV